MFYMTTIAVHCFQKSSTAFKTVIFGKTLSCFTFLRKLTAVDAHQLIDKIGTVMETLRSSVVTNFHSVLSTPLILC